MAAENETRQHPKEESFISIPGADSASPILFFREVRNIEDRMSVVMTGGENDPFRPLYEVNNDPSSPVPYLSSSPVGIRFSGKDVVWDSLGIHDIMKVIGERGGSRISPHRAESYTGMILNIMGEHIPFMYREPGKFIVHSAVLSLRSDPAVFESGKLVGLLDNGLFHIYPNFHTYPDDPDQRNHNAPRVQLYRGAGVWIGCVTDTLRPADEFMPVVYKNFYSVAIPTSALLHPQAAEQVLAGRTPYDGPWKDKEQDIPALVNLAAEAMDRGDIESQAGVVKTPVELI